MIDPQTVKDLEEVLGELHKARQMYTGSRLEKLTAKITRLEALYYSLKEAVREPAIDYRKAAQQATDRRAYEQYLDELNRGTFD
jgi:hypothetical protein